MGKLTTQRGATATFPGQMSLKGKSKDVQALKVKAMQLFINQTEQTAPRQGH